MVIAIQEKYCPACGIRNALHKVHEPCMGHPAQANCLICLNLQAVAEEWPKLAWRKRPHNTFAIPKVRKA